MSSKQLAKYVVALEAQTAKYQKGLDDARRKLSGFQKKQSVDLRKIAKGFAVVGAAAAAVGGAFAKLANDGLKLGDDAAKTASKLGLTVTALEGLRFAAQQSGVAQGELDAALQRSTRGIAQAAQGSGEASDALKRLGLDAQKLATQTPDQNMKDLAEAFEGVGTESERVRLAFKIFGAGGVGLVNTLKGGREALEAYERESAKFGLTLTRTQVEGVEKATDAQGRFASSLRGLRLQLGATLAPAFEKTADALASLISKFTQAIPKLADFASGILGIKRAVDSLTLQAVEIEMERLQETSQQLAAAYELVESRSRTLRDGTQTEATQLAQLATRIKEVQDRYEELGRRRAAIANGDEQAPGGGGLLDEEGGGGKLRGVNLSDQMKAVIKELEDAQKEADSVFRRTRTDVENYVQAIQNAQALLIRGLIDQDTFDRWVALHAESFDQIAQEAEETYDMIGEFAKQAARNMQSAFADFLFDPFSNGLSGMLKGFRDTLRRMVAEAASQQILTALFGTLGGSSNAFLSSIGKAFGGARASGGPVSAGKAYLVGEKGPELMVPGAGTIVPNHALGGSMTININAEDPGAEGRIRTMIEREMIPQIVNMAQARTIGALSRPSFA